MPTRNGSCIEATESAAERTVPPMVLVLMGVSGSGKSTVALELHRVLGWPFQEGDDLHPPSNVEKMRSGRPLDDADRMPWLQAVARWIDERLSAHEPGIITCSNLKRAYRQITIGTRQGVRLVFLKNDEHVIHARIVQRQHRYMPSALPRSQFETLRSPVKTSTRWLSPCEGPLPKRWPNYCSSWPPDISQLPNGSWREIACVADRTGGARDRCRLLCAPPVCGTRPRGTDRCNRFLGARHRYRRRARRQRYVRRLSGGENRIQTLSPSASELVFSR